MYFHAMTVEWCVQDDRPHNKKKHKWEGQNLDDVYVSNEQSRVFLRKNAQQIEGRKINVTHFNINSINVGGSKFSYFASIQHYTITGFLVIKPTRCTNFSNLSNEFLKFI